MAAEQAQSRVLLALEVGDFKTALSILPPGTPACLPIGGKDKSLVHYAASHGNAQVLQNLLADCTDEEIVTLSQSPLNPLQLAAQNGHSDAVSILIQRGVKHSSKAASPLHRACHDGHLGVIKVLVKENVCDVADRDVNGHTPLLVACRKGHIEVVKYFLEECHVDLRIAGTTALGSNILHFAVHSNRLDLVQYIVREVKISPTSVNDEGMTPLHRAADSGSTAVLRWLIDELKNDSFMKMRSIAGRNLLQIATIRDNLETVKYLVDEVKYDVSVIDGHGTSLVYLASEGGSVELVRYLVEEKGCDPFQEIPAGFKIAGRTPLHNASFVGNFPVVRYLVTQLNCDGNYQDADGVTPLMAAAQQGHMNILQLFCLEKKCDVNLLDKVRKTCHWYASLKGRVEVVKFLVEECKADIELADVNGKTAVLVAAEERHLPLVEYLVNERSCKVDGRNKNGLGLVHFGASNNWVGIMRSLVQKGVNPDGPDSSGLMPIHHAADTDAVDVLRYLIQERKCNPNAISEDSAGWTPLLRACLKGKLETVKYLVLERQVSMKPTKEKLTSPLHIAALQGHFTVLQFICENCSIDPDLRDKQGATPLHLAALEGHLGLVQYLIKKKCDPMARTKQDATAVHAAIQGGHLEILKYLLKECDTKSTWHDDMNSLVLRAVENGHLELLKYLVLNDICNIYEKNSRGHGALHYAAARGHMNIIKFCTEELGCDVMVGNTEGALPLHIACGFGHVAIARYLLSRNPAQVMYKDMTGLTPLQHAKKNNKLSDALLLEFLRQGAQPSHLEQVDPSNCGFLKHYEVIYSPLKLFMCGDIDPFLLQSSVRDQFVSGVSLALYNSRISGKALSYMIRKDLVSTGGILRDSLALCSHPLFLVGVDTRNSMGEILHSASMWLTLLASLLSDLPSTPKPLIVLAVAESTNPNVEFNRRVVDRLFSLPALQLFNHLVDTQLVYFTSPDSDNKGEMKLSRLISHFNNLLLESSNVPSFPSALLTFLIRHFRDCIFLSITELSACITEKHAPFPTDISELASLTTTLCEAGQMIFLKDETAVEKSWIVSEWAVFFSLLHGCLVDVPRNDKTALFLQNDLIDKICGSLDPSLVALALDYFGLCARISSSAGNVLFFPHLVDPRPSTGINFRLWQDERCYGWFLRCTPGNLLLPHFYTLLPAVLAVKTLPNLSFSPSDSPKLWKGGGMWETSDHFSVMVESPRVNAFIILIKGRVTNQAQLAKLANIRSSLIRTTFQLKEEKCPLVKVEELIIDPASLQDYTPEKSTSFGMASVLGMFQCKEDPDILSLLGFDPYFIIGDHLLTKLFSLNCEEAERTISENDVEVFAAAFENHSCALASILDCSDLQTENSHEHAKTIITEWTKKGRNRYIDLKNELDKFSIFAGRNPLVSYYQIFLHHFT